MASNVQNAVEEGKQVPRIQIYSSSATGVSQFWREKYERDAKKYWDVFYKQHQDKGAGRKTILEVGCGAGNTIFPLVATYPDIFVYACDFSPRAVNLVKAHATFLRLLLRELRLLRELICDDAALMNLTHKDFTDSHVSAFVCDLTADDLTDNIPPSSVDIVTMIFVLSAVSPEKMPLVLQNIRKVLKPSGYVLFRDYATGDLAQERLSCKDQKISENFYVRGDGTRAFYFSNEFLTSMFKENGFDVEELGLCCKQVENRSRELVMNRRWVQAVFRISDGINLSTKTEASIQVKENMLKDAVDNVEVDMSNGFAAEIFRSSASDENETIKLGDLNFEIKRLSKEYQHTCKSTGLMIWESARLMASVLARNPTIVSGKRVLELGSGCSGICSMVAAKHADLVIATDGDTKALDLLTQNVTSNLAPPSLDKLLVRKLEWGNRDHIEAIKEVNNRGFDIIIGTDVTYVSAAISPLFATAKELISSNGGISKGIEPGLILCHIFRRVDEPYMLSTAAKFGFRLIDNWPWGISSGPSENIINSWFPENGRENLPSTALNILYFRME